MSIQIYIRNEPYELNQSNLTLNIYTDFYLKLVDIDWSSDEADMQERIQELREMTYHNSILRELFLCAKAKAMGVKSWSEFDSLYLKHKLELIGKENNV